MLCNKYSSDYDLDVSEEVSGQCETSSNVQY